jgi:hypothetical protein
VLHTLISKNFDDIGEFRQYGNPLLRGPTPAFVNPQTSLTALSAVVTRMLICVFIMSCPILHSTEKMHREIKRKRNYWIAGHRSDLTANNVKYYNGGIN